MHETDFREPAPPSVPSLAAALATTMPLPKVARKAGRKRSTSANAELDEKARAEEVQFVLNQIQSSGNVLTHEVKKVAELRTRSGQVVYLVKTQSRMNYVVLAVHPENTLERLTRLPGVESVIGDHRFHSNMLRFPKKKNNGEKETAYGWHVITDSPEACERFLASL